MRIIKKIPSLVIFIGIFGLATGTLYAVFDWHISRLTEEVLVGWVKGEAVSIQEGQLLPAFAKNQRLLTSSDFIKGVALINIEQAKPFTEIEFGNQISQKSIQEALLSPKDFQLISLGSFHKLGVLRISSPQKFMVFFETRSVFFEKVFFTTVAIFCLLFLAMAFLIRRLEEKQALYANLASKVAHDIRSPINTLNHLASVSDLHSETNQVLLKKTIERLQFITSDLIKSRGDGFSEKPQAARPQPIRAKVIRQSWQDQVRHLINEKKALHSHFQGRKINLIMNVADNLTFELNEHFIRSISNLLDNAIEAIGLSGNVNLTVSELNNQIEFKIQDTGHGVPAEILPQIGQPKFSFGKTDGSGMGVYLAKKTTEELGGSFKFESVPGEGTTVTLNFPTESHESSVKYAVIDDDPLAHDMWKLQIRKQAHWLKQDDFKFFYKSEDLENWFNASVNRQIQLFVDSDLKEPRNGLQLIKDLGAEHLSFLVTHSFDDPNLKAKAAVAGVKVFSKAEIAQIIKVCHETALTNQ